MKFKKLHKIFLLGILIFILSFSVRLVNENVMNQYRKAEIKPKYIFLFIGDGMSINQIYGTEAYLGSIKSNFIKTESLNFTKFPYIGVMKTNDLTSYCPDSASTATAMATGEKTESTVIGLKADKVTKVENIAEKMKKAGYKIGIISSAPLNHGTAAAFYAHVSSRNQFSDIATEMLNSNFDFFGGGALVLENNNKEKEKEILKDFEKKGYKVTKDRESFLKLNKNDNKIYAISPNLEDFEGMTYGIDQKSDQLKLSNFVGKAIECLDNEKGFFIMAEGGKIDWACHGNDCKTAMLEVIEFDEAIKEAINFLNKHPKETLILVTADHETGGMALGNNIIPNDLNLKILENQKTSYVMLDKFLLDYFDKYKENEDMEVIFNKIEEDFGLTRNEEKIKEGKILLTKTEEDRLKEAFIKTVKNNRDIENQNKSYGGYLPLTGEVLKIINNRAGIGWSSYYHTASPVMNYSIGAKAEDFVGYYDNTEIFNKLINILKIA